MDMDQSETQARQEQVLTLEPAKLETPLQKLFSNPTQPVMGLEIWQLMTV